MGYNARMNVKASQKSSFIIFGSTGDLARTKLIPSLYKLFTKGLLPHNFSIVGYGRKEYSIADFQAYVEDIVTALALSESKQVKKKIIVSNFIERCSYVRGQLDRGEDYEQLKQQLDEQGIEKNFFYIAVPPSHYYSIISQLGTGGFLVKNASVILEKPFGENEKNAKEIDILLKKYIPEHSIYRMDHYLAKEALLSFFEEKKSFLFDRFWNDRYIERVDIKLYERGALAHRGHFYDQLGVLGDVGQNHLLQMLAAVIIPSTQNHPGTEYVSKQRVAMFNKIKIQPKSLMRAQYKGYRTEVGVAENSETETYFSADLRVAMSTWKNTLFHISAGKALRDHKAEIGIYFRKQGKQDTLKPFILSLNAVKDKLHINDQVFDPYEYVFLSVLKGDKTIFSSQQEALAGWKFVTTLKKLWKLKKTPLVVYKVGSQPTFK